MFGLGDHAVEQAERGVNRLVVRHREAACFGRAEPFLADRRPRSLHRRFPLRELSRGPRCDVPERLCTDDAGEHRDRLEIPELRERDNASLQGAGDFRAVRDLVADCDRIPERVERAERIPSTRPERLRMADRCDPPRIEARTTLEGALMAPLASARLSAAFRPL